MFAPPHVLVVEDRKELREVLITCLSAEGVIVSEAADGDEAYLRIFQAPAPDVVVSDIRMPKRSGLDLVREVRGKNSSIPFVLITGFGTTVDEPEVRALGRASVLAKPFEFEELMAHITRALEPRSASLNSPSPPDQGSRPQAERKHTP
jgi:DNA-binding response OmpR family regulator